MSRVAIVTGAAGFIGSHLCKKLLSLGFSVIGIDDLSVGRIENIAKLDPLYFNFIESDLATLKLSDFPASVGEVSALYHLAARADIIPSIELPGQYFESNVQGTFQILEIARKLKPRKLVYAASSSCYGIPDVYPTPETAKISTEYPYALTKYLGEELVLHWDKVYKVPAISLRLFNVYGPRARTSGTYGAVFGVFLAQKRAGKPLTVVGDGEQTRDFTYVSDVVDAFIAAANSKAHGEIFNVGSGGTYSVNRLAMLLGGKSIRIPKRPGEPDCTYADIEKIKRELGWEPKISFEQGVAKVLQHIDSWEDAPVWTPEQIADVTEPWFRYLEKK